MLYNSIGLLARAARGLYFVSLYNKHGMPKTAKNLFCKTLLSIGKLKNIARRLSLVPHQTQLKLRW